MRSISMLALAGVLAGLATAFAADHREAPAIQEDPTADLGDVYAFINPADTDKLVLIMTVNGFSVPAEAITYNFSPDVRYRFNIDNSGDAVAEHVIDVVFTATVPGPQMLRATLPGHIVIRGPATPPTEEPDPEDPVVLTDGDIKLFAGPRDDPFFFDIVGFFRFLAGTGGFTGDDSFAAFNVSAIVIELPVDHVADGSDSLQIWGQTDRLRAGVPRRATAKAGRALRRTAIFHQVDRTGVPAVNSVFIPSALKDAFNRGEPRDDASDFGQTILDTLAALGTNPANTQILASVAVPDTLKLDTGSTAGFPNGRALEDDVIDIILQLVLNDVNAGDLVDVNDVPFLSEFPFLAPPHQPPGP